MALLETYQDPIYGEIQLDELSDKFIKHPWFQRLKNIKQLGFSYKVFKNVTHTRYEHSIGVAYLCKLAGIQLNLDEKLIKLITIAGLMHDVGHGPQSHLFDSYLEKLFDVNIDEKKKGYYVHENRSVIIFNSIVKDRYLEIDLSKEDVNFIKDMILGNVENKLDKNRCLIELLNNSESKIDLDKLDYLNRDTYYYDRSIEKLDYEKIINSMKVINVNGLYELCYSYELVHEINNLFQRRFINHINIYQNLGVKAWELSYLDLLDTHESYIYEIFSDEFNIDKFCQLTDDYFGIIKCEYKIFGNKFQTDEKYQFKISKILRGTNLLCKSFEVNHGAKHENPINKINFYNNNVIVKVNQNDGDYEYKFKYLCYKEYKNSHHDFQKYNEIYDRLIISHNISFINT